MEFKSSTYCHGLTGPRRPIDGNLEGNLRSQHWCYCSSVFEIRSRTLSERSDHIGEILDRIFEFFPIRELGWRMPDHTCPVISHPSYHIYLSEFSSAHFLSILYFQVVFCGIYFSHPEPLFLCLFHDSLLRAYRNMLLQIVPVQL